MPSPVSGFSVMTPGEIAAIRKGVASNAGSTDGGPQGALAIPDDLGEEERGRTAKELEDDLRHRLGQGGKPLKALDESKMDLKKDKKEEPYAEWAERVGKAVQPFRVVSADALMGRDASRLRLREPPLTL